MDKQKSWKRFQQYYYDNTELGLRLDISRMNFSDEYFRKMEPRIQKAYAEMEELEKGAVANTDENRMVGHYWLRAPHLAPTPEISHSIQENIKRIKSFASVVHKGLIRPDEARIFKNFLLIGIGGSALGPQLLSDALGTDKNLLRPYFIDNTDPDGIDRVLAELGEELDATLVLVLSKSGGTLETSNGLQEVRHAFMTKAKELVKNAVAITMPGSKLDRLAAKEGWLAVFPLWDWVGGRTSVTSAVGLVPAALQGIDIEAFLLGAKSCDQETRRRETMANPAALLALMWYYATGGQGRRDMVILPYKDRLQYLARYSQQLVMESLGKELDREGKKVHQGISVYGNKGSTDQHAYVQQLLDGVNNFFVTFIQVLENRRHRQVYLQDGATSGDYLQAFFLGTRQALTQRGRESVTITLERLDAFSLGALIALFERAVGLYACLVNVNAYHQPGVELGKKGANMIIDMLAKSLAFLMDNPGMAYSLEDIASATGWAGEEENLFQILELLAADKKRGVKRIEGKTPFEATYSFT